MYKIQEFTNTEIWSNLINDSKFRLIAPNSEIANYCEDNKIEGITGYVRKKIIEGQGVEVEYLVKTKQ